jgi:hypothetical protein
MVAPYLPDSVGERNPKKHRRIPADESIFEIKPDVIIITHDHLDHLDPKTLEHFLSREGDPITVLAPENAYKKLLEFGGDHNYVLLAPHSVWSEGEVKEHEDYVVVKIVGWDDKWKIEWIENGCDMGAMEQISILDPDYMKFVDNEANYKKKYMERLRKSAHPHDHYFRCKRTSENSEITIVATDRFGRQFTTSVK